MPNGSIQVRYTDEVAETIVRLYSQGIPLTKIAAQEGMPDRPTIWRWEKDERRGSFASALARARKMHAEARAMRSGEHLDDLSDDDLKELGSAASSAVRLRESRSAYDWKLAERLDRDTWAERTQVDIKGTLSTLVAFADMKPAAIPVDAEATEERAALPHVAPPDVVSESDTDT